VILEFSFENRENAPTLDSREDEPLR
jgi:hypothetical protein